MKRMLFAGLWAVFSAGCATLPLPPVTTSQAQTAGQRWPGTTFEKLEASRALYTSACAECHTLPAPVRHKYSEWPKIMREMAGKAKLTAHQEEDLLIYVQSLVLTTGPL